MHALTTTLKPWLSLWLLHSSLQSVTCWKLFSLKLTFQADLEFRIFPKRCFWKQYLHSCRQQAKCCSWMPAGRGGRVLLTQPETGSCNAEMPGTEPGTLAAVRRGERLPLPGHNSSSPKAGVSNWADEPDLKNTLFSSHSTEILWTPTSDSETVLQVFTIRWEKTILTPIWMSVKAMLAFKNIYTQETVSKG